MCCGKIIRILHSRVEQFILSSRVHSISQWFSTFSLKGAKSRSTILWESGTKKNLAQVNSNVLFYCRTKSVTQHIFIDIARGPMGPFSSLTFRTYNRFVLERRYPKQNCVNSLAPNFWLVTLLVLLKGCWELHRRCLGAACNFQKSGFNLLVVQHLKWLWRLAWNVDCCGQFGGGEIGV